MFEQKQPVLLLAVGWMALCMPHVADQLGDRRMPVGGGSCGHRSGGASCWCRYTLVVVGAEEDGQFLVAVGDEAGQWCELLGGDCEAEVGEAGEQGV